MNCTGCLVVRHRIVYKVATITNRTRNCQQPSYLLDSLVSYQPAITLRSSSSYLLIVPNRFKTVTASRAFRVEAPTIWNNLFDFVKVRTTDTFNVMRNKTHRIRADSYLVFHLEDPKKCFSSIQESVKESEPIPTQCAMVNVSVPNIFEGRLLGPFETELVQM